MGTHDDAPGDDRRRRLVALLDTAPAGGGLRGRLDRLCTVAVSELGVSGAGVTVMGSTAAGLAGARDQLSATGGLARRLEELQLTVGEGPCLDAFDGGCPVLAGDLAAETARWLGFSPEALAAGATAVFSLPLQIGAVRLGTLDLHRDTIGPLSPGRLADALVLAALAAESLLEFAGAVDPDVSGDAAASSAVAGWLLDVHAEVHQAAGMVSASEDIAVGDALLRLRAHALARGEPINQVARRVIDRDLVLRDSVASESDALPDPRRSDRPDPSPEGPDAERER